MTVALFESSEEFHRRRELQTYVLATPLGRYLINRRRRRLGKPPFRTREAKAELTMRERRLQDLIRGEA